ncbi:asparagine synthase-related protein [Rugamonas sp. DEMB1]|uniref:asparagine synthase-related protein n=1 Tax=Rugamonas sp. DEMB1 TaxID=3039386 RepID=UPI00244B5980|nr:asparagine synthase-related protein [Rugamonas sp. DEMB1]WGG50492.1 asparagine synthase-related protein [Rugamonas sp. DEMB1]
MLSLRIHRRDVARRWLPAADGWQAGASRIAPWAHPALEHFMLEDGERSCFVVRERWTGAAAPAPRARLPARQFDAALAALRGWPLDQLILLVDARGDGQVALHAGEPAGAPLCLLTRDDTLYAHWDAARLYPYLTPGAIRHEQAAAMLYASGTPCSRTTLFREIGMLTERASACWRGGARLELAYPPPRRWGQARATLAAADVPAAFETLLAAILRRHDMRGTRMACQLSGGIDSALLSLIAARHGPRPLATYGLLMPGRAGRAQQRRRERLRRACGARDTAVAAIEHLPFARSWRLAADPVVPWGEFYHEAFGALMRRARANGDLCMVSGIGGDELAALQWDELDTPPAAPADEAPAHAWMTAPAVEAARTAGLDPAPAGVAFDSVYGGLRAGATLYLREGIWPLYPYAVPELVQLCRALPACWRRDRALQRHCLRRAGLPGWVYRPAVPENFLDVLHSALGGNTALAALARDARLAELGLVQPAAFERALRHPPGPGQPHALSCLMAAVTLELSLRAVEESRKEDWFA